MRSLFHLPSHAYVVLDPLDMVNQCQEVPSGPTTALALGLLLLAPGTYCVAGHAPYLRRYSRAFVLEVSPLTRFVLDADTTHVPLVEYASQWMTDLQWVCWVVLYAV